MLRILVVAFLQIVLCHTASATAADKVAKTGEALEKSAKAKSKSFLQVGVAEQSQSQSQMQFSAIRRNIIAEMARVDKDMMVDDDEAATSENARSEHSHKFASLVQLGSKDIDDNDADAADMAGLDESDIMDDENDADQDGDNSESLVQLKSKNVDDDNLEAAQRARLDALMDKDMDTDLDDDGSATADDSSK